MTYAEMKRILSMTDDAAEKLEIVMDFGAHMPPVPDSAVCSDIVGCASWVQICRVFTGVPIRHWYVESLQLLPLWLTVKRRTR